MALEYMIEDEEGTLQTATELAHRMMFEAQRPLEDHIYMAFGDGQPFTTTTTTHQPQENNMARISNQDWLLHENQDILNAIGNPEINYVEVTPTRNDDISDYKNYGFNILRLNETRRPVGLPGEAGAIIREHIRCDMEIMQLNIKIPNTRTRYNFNGRIFIPNTRMTISQNLYRLFPEIRLDSIEHANQHNGRIDVERLPLATVLRNTIWIHWDLSERNTTNKALVRYILKKAGEMINPEEFPRKKPDNYEEDQFLKTIREFEEQKLDGIKETLISLERQSQDGFQSYLEAERDIRKLKLVLSAEQATTDEIKKTAKEAIAYFKDHKNIKSWQHASGVMTFVLQNIEINYNQETIKVPNPKVTIDLRNGKFIATSADPEYQIPQVHPHIFPDGRACAGNFTSIFPKIVRDGKFIQIVELLIQFFQSYNPESPAIPWYKWRWLVNNHKTEFENGEEELIAAREYADYLEKVGETDERTQSALEEED
jgi:hypothetical protein